jgi:nucleoid-associated protein YgaU
MSRTVIALMAVGAVIIAAALGYAWRVKMDDQAALDAVKPAAPIPSAAAAATTTPPPAAPAAPAESRPAPQASVMVPTFDVARIGRDGRAVIAGRAAPGAKIVLLDGGKEIARGEADARGEWVVLAQEPPLAPGPHELRAVQHIDGRAPVTSEQVVVAVVPSPPGVDKASRAAEETLVMISPQSGAATLVQPPSSAGVPKVGDLQVSTLDYDERGQATITGRASPGTTVRAYLDDKPVAEGKAGTDGRWRLAPDAPLETGQHRLRVDRLAQDGKPVARLEMKFERQEAAPGDKSRRLHVVRGDNLWNIARAHYGEGFRYTTIFDANKDQIRDPNLIYPGQTFSLPKVN